ncbi:histidinol-phosphate transaminase [Microbacterium hydrocarbonoxydans]|uniref:histidinol-phosphate transaminase n=1 Tax=Microbacterium hydrocarbonoxydans TaxID=273678 RepID=UPI0007BC597C|nr:histidinol-phosphate transaminase [Microbacterium hydrocarbonoxydans]GAT71829.1 histidinol-phosphate/aromatic aminotransferase and cobyric acid decarboxylase [Microbacterium sp. HM58-2]
MTDPILPRIRPAIAALAPYRQGKQAGPEAFKLSSNENPFEPLPSVVDALQRATPINRYPDATAGRLRERLAARYAVDPNQVHVAAGSVSILHQLILATSSVGDEVIYAWRSFEAYPSLPLVAGATGVQVPLTADSRHDLDAMADAVTDRTRAIILCTPNNPTGPIITGDEFANFVERVPADVLIVLDEAYAEFVTAPDAIDGLAERVFERHPNVVVLRTFSKAYGLAGLRIGYAIGNEKVLDAARTTGIPLSVTGAAENAAIASLDAEKELLARVDVIVERRTRLVEGLRAQGWDVPDAQGNFVWLPTGEQTDAAAATLVQNDLIVRPFSGDGIRISVGEEDSVARILDVAAALRGAL